MSPAPSVLVTGATGLIGREILACLAADPEVGRVRVLARYRPSSRILWPHRRRVKVVWGDLRRPEDVARAVDGVDVVIHAGAIIPPRADHHPDLADATNVDGTANVVNALTARSQPARLVYTSSISLYGDRLAQPWIRVTDPLTPSPGDHYATTKLRAEGLIRASGLPATIVRLAAIIGPSIRPNPLMFHMPLDTKLEVCSSRDCGYALTRLIHHPEVAGRTFNLGGGERMRTTYREFVNALFEVFGLGRDLLPESAFATKDFHCGYYEDGGELDAITHHQRDRLEDLYGLFRASWPTPLRLLTRLGRPVARRVLLAQSHVYSA
jgi:nucleoside-diphosphate-sugar epimerase